MDLLANVKGGGGVIVFPLEGATECAGVAVRAESAGAERLRI